MKNTAFHKDFCSSCGKRYDSALQNCPSCGTPNPEEEIARSWKECTPLGLWREVFCFLYGLVGLQIIQIIVEVIVIAINKGQIYEPGMSNEAYAAALTAFLSSGNGLAAIFFPTYAILFVGFIIALWKYLKPLAKRFANIKTLWGIATVVVLYLFSFAYGNLISRWTGGADNQNQNNVVSVINAYPVYSIIIFGFVGPFCEECAYRLGLMNALKRWNTIAAYILSALIFGFIHFDWTNAGSAIEWLNLPPYIISGLALGITYDKFGFGASYVAHALNNTLSVILSLIAQKASA